MLRSIEGKKKKIGMLEHEFPISVEGVCICVTEME